LNVFHLLGIETDLPMMPESETFDLLYDTTFGAMAAVKERRHHG
jgi:hypothetical protein